MPRRRRLLGALAITAAVLLGGATWYAWAGGEILAGYAAKTLCTCVFVAGRDPASCLTEELAPYRSILITTIDRHGRRVEAWTLRVRHAEARFRDGVGCALH